MCRKKGDKRKSKGRPVSDEQSDTRGKTQEEWK